METENDDNEEDNRCPICDNIYPHNHNEQTWKEFDDFWSKLGSENKK